MKKSNKKSLIEECELKTDTYLFYDNEKDEERKKVE
jgi:hypothetical protein